MRYNNKGVIELHRGDRFIIYEDHYNRDDCIHKGEECEVVNPDALGENYYEIKSLTSGVIIKGAILGGLRSNDFIVTYDANLGRTPLRKDDGSYETSLNYWCKPPKFNVGDRFVNNKKRENALGVIMPGEECEISHVNGRCINIISVETGLRMDSVFIEDSRTVEFTWRMNDFNPSDYVKRPIPDFDERKNRDNAIAKALIVGMVNAKTNARA